MTTFPRRVFAEEDYEKPLDILGGNQNENHIIWSKVLRLISNFFSGLAPSAVVIVSKLQPQV